MQSPEAMHREALYASDSAKAESCHMPRLSSVGREEIAETHKAFFFSLYFPLHLFKLVLRPSVIKCLG